jgi:2-succinyl-5-enolpyruvyl-6-hydroxy-3-cyclohexene-1-carboxylate synthase
VGNVADPAIDAADAADRAAEAARRVTYAYVGAFFEELMRSGVEHVCVSPGSRSAPLAISAARTPGLELIPILDERSAGFFALGLARQSGRPVALVCTSGTAASNYLPAVTESNHARVPLLILTADRPPELREWGAGQTIDQIGLYGRSVRRFVEVPVPIAGDAMLRHARALAARAVGDATATPAGPVHLNWPFREPLDPPRAETRASARTVDAGALAPIRVTQALASARPEDIAALAEFVRERPRGVIACGPLAP